MIIIGVHYPQRELVGKLLLAHKAAHRYGSSVIGRTGSIRRCKGQVFQHSFRPLRFGKKLSSGVVVDVALTPEASAKGRFPAFIEQGFNLASFDEEATAFWDPAAFARRRIDEKSAGMVDVLYSWGAWHNESALNNTQLSDHAG